MSMLIQSRCGMRMIHFLCTEVITWRISLFSHQICSGSKRGEEEGRWNIVCKNDNAIKPERCENENENNNNKWKNNFPRLWLLAPQTTEIRARCLCHCDRHHQQYYSANKYFYVHIGINANVINYHNNVVVLKELLNNKNLKS